MNPTQLLTHFHRLAEAPDAIPRLRRFILDLAVRGKLVAQNPKDERAAKLLQRIQAEKERLVKEGSLKKTEPASPAKDSDCPFQLPTGWGAARLQSLCLSVTDGDHLPPPKADVGVPFLVIGNVRDQTIKFSGCRHVADDYYNALDPIRRPKQGDLLYTLVGSYGIPVLVRDDRPFCVQRHIGILRPSESMNVHYLSRALASEFVYEQATACATGIAQKTVPLSGLRKMIIPLPPLAEQRRIVAKVDELMALCDRLEAAQAERERRRERLVAATHAGLTTDEPQHASFFIRQFPQLATRADQIPQLRQTILNLAVRGQLVPQNAKDEPAAELLHGIQIGKQSSPQSSKVSMKKKPSSEVLIAGHPHGWEIVRFGDICQLVTSGSRGWAEYYADSGPKFIRAQNIRFGRLRFDDLACVSLPKKTEGTRTQVSRGDLLIVITGAGVTNPALLDVELGEAYVSQHVALIKPKSVELSNWMLLCLMAPSGGRAELIERAYGAGKPGLNLDNIRSLKIPLPPLAEQQRIVAKVAELMALCDRLEAQLSATQTGRRRLLDAVLHEALAA